MNDRVSHECFVFLVRETPGLNNKLPKPVVLKGSRSHHPRLPLSWAVFIPLGEQGIFDLFSQSGLEQAHIRQAQ